MPLTKEDTLHAKGIAIISMLMLHLFCRIGNLPYTPLIWIGDTPLIYYLGLFGDICVPIYCFCAGYSHYLLQNENQEKYVRQIPNKILRFLVNYWIIVVLFSIVGLLFDQCGNIPGSFKSFLGNILVVGMSYNGAWWFVATYLFLLLFSPYTAYITKKLTSITVCIFSAIFYLISYLFRFQWNFDFHPPIFNWIWQQLILFGTSQFPYMVGMIAFKAKIPERLRSYCSISAHRLFKYLLVGIAPLFCFIIHCLEQSLIIAPITALSVLVSLFLLKLPTWLGNTLAFLGKHSTNIWFTHMFFYLTLFPGLVFHAKYPILILMLMLSICLPISFLIDHIYQPIRTRIDRFMLNFSSRKSFFFSF